MSFQTSMTAAEPPQYILEIFKPSYLNLNIQPPVFELVSETYRKIYLWLDGETRE